MKNMPKFKLLKNVGEYRWSYVDLPLVARKYYIQYVKMGAKQQGKLSNNNFYYLLHNNIWVTMILGTETRAQNERCVTWVWSGHVCHIQLIFVSLEYLHALIFVWFWIKYAFSWERDLCSSKKIDKLCVE